MTRNALATARIVLVASRGLLRDIVRDVVIAQSDLRLLAEVHDPRSLPAVLDRMPTDVVIWTVDDVAAADMEEQCRRLLDEHPRLAVLTVEDDGRTGLLCQLRPQQTRLGELSPQLLLEVIRGAVRL